APSGREGNRLFNNVRGLVYNSFDDQLFFTNHGNGPGAGGDTLSVFVINRPRNIRGFAKPAYQVLMVDSVWAVHLDFGDLYMSKIRDNGAMLSFRNFLAVFNAKPDTFVDDMTPTYRLSVPGASNIRGFDYANASHIFVVTDYAQS